MADGNDDGGTSSWELDELPVAALVERDGVIRTANEPAGAVLGHRPAELAGRSLDEVVAAARATIEAHPGPCAGRDRLVVLQDVTEERILNAIVDAVADSTLVIDRDGLVAWQSERLTERIGMSADALGVNPMERIHPEDLPYSLESFGRSLADPTFFTRYNVRSRSPEDDDLWQLIEITGASRIDDPDLEGVVVQVRNLDEGEAIGSVGEATGRFQSLADAAPIGIVALDARGRTVFRNAAARTLLEQRADLHLGLEWREQAQGHHRVELDAMVDDALGGAERTTTAAFETASGRPLWLRVKVVPHRTAAAQEDASVVGAIVTLEDVTAEVEARQATERLTHMLDATADFVAVWRPSTGEILYVNAATHDALVALRAGGRRGVLTDLIDDVEREAFVAEALAVLETSDTWRGELPLNVVPGTAIPVSAIGVARRDDTGAIDWIAMLARDISELKAAEGRLRELATRDVLTGLANRALFNDRLALAAARQQRSHHGLAVLFCDLDGFKPINDAYGHSVGDQVLVEIAQRLARVTRDADTVARVGGDEFVMICEGIVDDTELGELADRVIGVVSQPISVAESTVRVGISIGIGVVPNDGHDVDPDRLLSTADSAMYRAKARGGNGFRIVPYRAVDGHQG
jgi:diguanylate cyclase (GGDEF)-like protein/PAS domain S-box-containing protein